MIPSLLAHGRRPREMSWRDFILGQSALLAMSWLACLGGELVARALWHWQAGTHVLGVAPPLLLAGLVSRSRRDWPAIALGASIGMALALRLAGAETSAAAVLALGPAIAALSMAIALQRWPAGGWPPAGLWQGIGMLLGAGLLVPLFDASWLLAWSNRFGFANYAGEGRGLLLAQVSGHLLLLPLLLGAGNAQRPSREGRARRWSVATILFVVPVLLWTVPGLASMPSALMTVATLPLLLWVLVEWGLAGVSITLLLLALLGIRLSLNGLGPFSGLPVDRATLGLQTWICVMAAAMWLMAVLLQQRRAATRELHDTRRQLGDLTGRLLVVQEEERTRIARDLHDDINQQLAAVSIRLSYLKRGGSDAQRDEVAAIQQDLLKVSSDIRAMSHELHPSVLRFTGLTSALTGFCQHHSARTALRMHCEVDAPDGLAPEHELGLFRIVQEAVSNIEKHARASHVWVQLEMRGPESVLSISDDGVGLPARRDACGLARAGLGMTSMEERARLLGGSLRLAARPGGGTRVEVRFPCPRTASDN